jgi:uncharacterized protein (TIGR02217 family)
MCFEFHEIILDPKYAPNAEGGPEFGNKLFESPDNGLDAISVGRAKARHRYTVEWQNLIDQSRIRMRNLFYTIGGMRGGFRLVPPDDDSLNNELIGTGDGVVTSWKLIKTYSVSALPEYGGETLSYERRIVKPVFGTMTFWANMTQLTEVSGPPIAGQVKMDYTSGVITTAALSNGVVLKASGRFHVPVRFGGDYFNPKYDVAADWSGIELIEILPKALDIE